MLSKYDQKLERYPLPPTADGICTLIRDILDIGHVGRIEIDTADAYIRAWRFVEKGEMEEPDISWDGALRNVRTMLEYTSEGATAFQTVVDMMLLAQEHGLRGSMWAVGFGGVELLRQWFTLNERNLPVQDIASLVGVPIRELKSLPRETLILCCSAAPNADPSEITMAIKTAIELRSNYVEGDGTNSGGGGNHSAEYHPSTGQMAAGSRGLHSVLWKKESKPGI